MAYSAGTSATFGSGLMSDFLFDVNYLNLNHGTYHTPCAFCKGGLDFPFTLRMFRASFSFEIGSQGSSQSSVKFNIAPVSWADSITTAFPLLT